MVLTEYAYGDVERKFRESTIKATVRLASGVSATNYYYIHGLDTDEDDNVRVCAQKFPMESDAKWYFVNTATKATAKYPRMEPIYWNPENGLYHGTDGNIYAVTRRRRRTFCVGLNHQSYTIQRYLKGKLGDPCAATAVDPSKPRVFDNSDIITERIYRVGTSLFFDSCRIGLIQENNIYLSNPDYLHFLPEKVKGLCTVNH